jgi:hypothetical protein
MRSWKRKPGQPARPPRLTLTPETPELLTRLAAHLHQNPAEIVFQALRLFAAVFEPPPDPTKSKKKTRGGPVVKVDAMAAVDNILRNKAARDRRSHRRHFDDRDQQRKDNNS